MNACIFRRNDYTSCLLALQGPSAAMPEDKSIPLSCLVYASDTERMRALIANTLKDEARIDVGCVSTQTALRYKLASTRPDMLVIALDNAAERLPASLHRYPDLPILVVTPGKKTGPIDKWLDQGATDVVSQHRYDRFRHSVLRMLNESKLRAEQSKLLRQLSRADQFQQMLLNLQKEAVFIWQNGRIIESNRQFDRLIVCDEANNLARTIAFKRWMSEETKQLIELNHDDSRLGTVMTNTSGQQYQAIQTTLVLDNGPAKLWRLSTTASNEPSRLPAEKDTVTGLLTRVAFTKQLQRWIDSRTHEHRFVALHVHLPDLQSESGSQGINGTLQDLMAYRACSSIELGFDGPFFMGRTDKQSLLLVHDYIGTESRRSALTVKSLLGSLGGLIDDPGAITIKTLTLSHGSLAAEQVLERLESRWRNTVRVPRQPTSRTNKTSALKPLANTSVERYLTS